MTGSEFSHWMEAIIEFFDCIKEYLEQERWATGQMWSNREKQIQRVVTFFSDLDGDLQGIGATLPKLERLEFPADSAVSEAES